MLARKICFKKYNKMNLYYIKCSRVTNKIILGWKIEQMEKVIFILTVLSVIVVKNLQQLMKKNLMIR